MDPNDRLVNALVVMLCFWLGLMVGLVIVSHMLGYA
jgi:hypothetical protein